MLTQSISFIIPCYNEEKNLQDTINEIIYALKKSNINKYEMWVLWNSI